MESFEKAKTCAKLADEKKAFNIVILELKGISVLADYFIICTGTSSRHVQAITDNVEYEMKQLGEISLGKEGSKEGKWVLLDYNDVIVHVMQENEREFYDLDRLWSECQRITFDG